MTGFTYKSYNFGTEKDPIIDEVRTVFEQSGWTYQRVEDESGVTYATLRNWFEGKTRKPASRDRQRRPALDGVQARHRPTPPASSAT